ncbi:MAG: DNA-processing protein DprA, partial [Candidatus Saccharicenans sp.]
MRSKEHLVFRLVLNYLVIDGYLSAKKAFQFFDSEEKVFQPDKNWLGSLKVSQTVKEKLLSGELLVRAERELEKLEKKEYTLLPFEDSRYPQFLREVVEPPLVLYCYGQAEILGWAAVAMVGSRRPTSYGRLMAEKLAEQLAATGLVVVSGLARGIDTLAHKGALRSGLTVAVLGSGLENLYPKENRMLAEKIAEKGAVVSEFPLDSEPLGFHFPRRNRLISGLSLACLVIEASRHSGALITAKLAADQGREVLALPGPVTSELSQGTNFLLKQGARLVETAEDIILELPSPWKEAALNRLAEKHDSRPELVGRERQVYEALPENSVIHIDDLSDKIQIGVAELLAILLSLEMKELVVQEAGKFFR